MNREKWLKGCDHDCGVVCQNTLNLALRLAGAERIAIGHHASLEQHVAEAREKWGLIAARFDAFDEELHALLDAGLSVKQVDEYFDGLLPEAKTDREKKNRKDILDHLNGNFENERNNLPGIRGTAWSAFNAVSEWADHQRTLRGKDDLARTESRLNSIWFGTSHQIKQKAYAGALELAGVN